MRNEGGMGKRREGRCKAPAGRPPEEQGRRRPAATHLPLEDALGAVAPSQQCREAQCLAHSQVAQQCVALREREAGGISVTRPRPGCGRLGRGPGKCPPAGHRRSSPGTAPCAVAGRSQPPPRGRSPCTAASRTWHPAAWFSPSL